jgi:hypothetical protein
MRRPLHSLQILIDLAKLISPKKLLQGSVQKKMLNNNTNNNQALAWVG